MNTPVNKKGFAQICILVPDIEKSAEKWAEVLGCEKPTVRKTHLEGNENYTYRGQPVSCDLLVTEIEMPGFVIELHQVVGGDSTFKEFVEKHLGTINVESQVGMGSKFIINFPNIQEAKD